MAISNKNSYDLNKINFKLNTPYISKKDKLFFLKEFVNPNFKFSFNVKSCQEDIDLVVKEDTLEEKFLSRVCYYLKNYVITLGNINYEKYGLTKKEAQYKLIDFLNQLNAQFNIYVKSNPVILNKITEKLNNGILKYEELFSNPKPLNNIYQNQTENKKTDLYLKERNLSFKNFEEKETYIKDHSHKNLFNINKEWIIPNHTLDYTLQLEKNVSGINAFDVGLGKAQPLFSKILVPTKEKFKMMRDIKVGDEVYAYDGTISKVTGVFPQGKKKVFEILFNDGSASFSCDEHLWFTQTMEELKQSKKTSKKNSGIKTLLSGSVKELKDIINTMDQQHVIPTVCPIDFKEKSLPIHPYLYGMLLNNKSYEDLTAKQLHVIWQYVEKEQHKKLIWDFNLRQIGEIVKNFYKKEVLQDEILNKYIDVFMENQPKLQITLSQEDLVKLSVEEYCEEVTGKFNKVKYWGEPLWDKNNLEEMEELYVKSLKMNLFYRKNLIIEEDYLSGSLEQRLNLLQGLLDFGGCVNKKQKAILYNCLSKNMALKIKELVLSLGGTCHVYEYDDIDNRYNTDVYYHLVIKFSTSFKNYQVNGKTIEVKPFKHDLYQKLTIWNEIGNVRPLRTIKEIKYVGEEECQCIMIDHPSHLYITDHYVVTHNTSTSLIAVQNLHNKQIKQKTLFVVPQSTLSNFYKEALLGEKNIVNGEEKQVKPSVYLDGSNCLFFLDRKNIDDYFELAKSNQYKKIFMTYEDFFRLKLKKKTLAKYLEYLTFHDQDINTENKQFIKFLIKINKLNESGQGKTKEDIYFEDLNIDSLIIDEVHVYKNSKELFSNINAKYLSIPPISIKGLDAQIKAWYVRQFNKENYGKEDGVVGLTATPLTNSPLEYYSLLTLIIGEENFNALTGLNGSGEFMNSTCEIESEEDFTVDGREKIFDVFKGIKNLSILRPILFKVITFLSHEEVREKTILPNKKEIMLQSSLNEEQRTQLIFYKKAYNLAKSFIYAQSIEEAQEIERSKEWDVYVRPLIELFYEKPEIIASPFNFISKMEKLILDEDLNDNGISFYIENNVENNLKIQEIINLFNNKKIKEKRVRPNYYTNKEDFKLITETFTVNGEERYIEDFYEVKVKAKIVDFYKKEILLSQDLLHFENEETSLLKNKHNLKHCVRIFVDSLDYKTQLTFYKMLLNVFKESEIYLTSSSKINETLKALKKENDFPVGKIKISANNENEEIINLPYAKQLVFCDHIGSHLKLQILISQLLNIKFDEIAIITGQTNNSTEEILDIQYYFNSLKENKYKIILANEKAEVGINLQNGTQAIHHLTYGWTPDSIHQRNGRAVRQFNYTKEVSIYENIMKNTFDIYKRNLVNNKENWISKILDKNGEDYIPVSNFSKKQYEEMIEKLGDEDLEELNKKIEEENRQKEIKTIINKQKNCLNCMTSSYIKLMNKKHLENTDNVKKDIKKEVFLSLNEREKQHFSEMSINELQKAKLIAEYFEQYYQYILDEIKLNKKIQDFEKDYPNSVENIKNLLKNIFINKNLPLDFKVLLDTLEFKEENLKFYEELKNKNIIDNLNLLIESIKDLIKIIYLNKENKIEELNDNCMITNDMINHIDLFKHINNETYKQLILLNNKEIDYIKLLLSFYVLKSLKLSLREDMDQDFEIDKNIYLLPLGLKTIFSIEKKKQEEANLLNSHKVDVFINFLIQKNERNGKIDAYKEIALNYLDSFSILKPLQNKILFLNAIYDILYDKAKEEYIHLHSLNTDKSLPLSLLTYADQGKLFKFYNEYLYDGAIFTVNHRLNLFLNKTRSVGDYIKSMMNKENKNVNDLTEQERKYIDYDNKINKNYDLLPNFNSVDDYFLNAIKAFYNNLKEKRIANNPEFLLEKDFRVNFLEEFGKLLQKINFSILKVKTEGQAKHLTAIYEIQDDMFKFVSSNRLCDNFFSYLEPILEKKDSLYANKNFEMDVIYEEDERFNQLNIFNGLINLYNAYIYCYRSGGISKTRLEDLIENLSTHHDIRKDNNLSLDNEALKDLNLLFIKSILEEVKNKTQLNEIEIIPEDLYVLEAKNSYELFTKYDFRKISEDLQKPIMFVDLDKMNNRGIEKRIMHILEAYHLQYKYDKHWILHKDVVAYLLEIIKEKDKINFIPIV